MLEQNHVEKVISGHPSNICQKQGELITSLFITSSFVRKASGVVLVFCLIESGHFSFQAILVGLSNSSSCSLWLGWNANANQPS